MKPPLPLDHNDSEYNEQDREIVQILKELGNIKATYPPERLAARRTAFLAQVERLRAVELDEESSAEDQEIVKLLGQLKSAQAAYPPELLAARRSAFVHQLETAGQMSLLDRLRVSIRRIFPSNTKTPTSPAAGLRRLSPAIAGLVAALLIGALFLSRAEQTFQLSPSETAAAPTPLAPTGSSDVSILLCKPGDQTPSCPSGELGPSQDLADPQNGLAQPAVSSQSGMDGIHRAAFVNDGRSGASWVSKSADSWVKIDLGKVKTINAVSLQKGSLGPSQKSDPGQFVIAVALSDLYADGNSSNDYAEYAQVFRSEQTGFSGTVSDAETILTQFPPVKARFVKITFEKAGAAIEEAGVFLMPPPVLAERPTRKPPEEASQMTAPTMGTNTASLVDTMEPTIAAPTDTSPPTFTNTVPPLATSTSLPTDTLLPTDTPIPVPTEPLPSDTPVPLPTVNPPTAIPATVQDSPIGADPIIVSGHDQTLIYICNGNAVEIRGNANSVTLLGSCSSITVTGNRNRVVWEFGSPIITNQGKDNLITQS
jgi:F5/8 type C domain/Protein of unknown function (DUF3060)